MPHGVSEVSPQIKATDGLLAMLHKVGADLNVGMQRFSYTPYSTQRSLLVRNEPSCHFALLSAATFNHPSPIPLDGCIRLTDSADVTLGRKRYFRPLHYSFDYKSTSCS